MIGRALRASAVLLVGLGLVAACGSSDRPEDLPLSDAKPCQLILRPRLDVLHVINGPNLVDIGGGVGMEGTSCTYDVLYKRPTKIAAQTTSNGVMLSVVTNHGIGWKIDEVSERDNVDYKDVRRIQGFRTVREWDTSNPPGPNTACELYVDVADDQMLRVEVDRSIGDEDPPTCETARRFADEALKTLRARNG